jgi:hypothetical protein
LPDLRDATATVLSWSIVVLLCVACGRSGFRAPEGTAARPAQQPPAAPAQPLVEGTQGGLALALPSWSDRLDPASGYYGGRRRDGAPHELYFTRAAYSGMLSRGYPTWQVDFPKADIQFLIGLRRLVPRLDAYPYDNPILLDDPDISRYPFLYAVEVGYMRLSDAETEGLRRYLLAGGFLVVDDFWGTREWSNWAAQLARILPEHSIVDIPLDHPIFHCFYDVDEVVQVPNVGQGRSGGPTWERDGFEPMVRGVFDEKGRLMVVINWNSDLGDAWEWAEDPFYPLRFSTYAYQMGVNFIVYAMSH